MTGPEKKPLTARERKMLLIGMAVGAAVVGVVVLAWNYARADGDESGIRVKNGGSVVIETVSGEGFGWAFLLHYKTKAKSKGSFSLRVIGADCGAGPTTLEQVKKVAVVVPDDSIEMEDRGNRIHVDVSWLAWKAEGAGISYGDRGYVIQSVEATGRDGNGNSATLRCSFVADSSDDLIELIVP